MGTSTEQARQAVAATRGRIEANADLLEARLRYDLDAKRRLRRDGPRVAAGLAVVVLVGAVYVVRSRRQRKTQEEERDWLPDMPKEWRERLEELLAEAAARRPLPTPDGARRKGKRSLRTSVALKAARVVAPVVISAVVERIGPRPAESKAPALGAEQPQREGGRWRWWRERSSRA